VSYADLDAVIRRSMRAWRPPPRLTLSEWADEYFVLSSESAAEPGRWKTLPYQKGLLDAITDPLVSEVSVMKSARVGFTLCMSAAIGYFMHQDPSSILVVQPTVDDAKNYSKETIAPMLRDVPVLAGIVFRDLEEKGPKDSSMTLTHKAFPGGVLSLVGANSGTGFRRVSRRVIALDEVDAYPQSAGSEGDPVRLATMRSQAFWNRKRIAGSTPLVAGSSRIADLFAAGDQRRYFVPCPQCGHMAPFVFRGDGGHVMKWPEGEPDGAFFACQANGCIIEHREKRDMVAEGEWRAAAPFTGHASFHIWSAYSYSPNATWSHIAREFVASKGDSQALRTFVNTWLGETWQERGEAPDWQRLYQRREPYDPAIVPDEALILTAGVDVQRDRLVFDVVAWGAERQSWGIDAGEFYGDPAQEEVWTNIDELLCRKWPKAKGGDLGIHMLAVDSGDQTQTVYSWARRYPLSRVIACKGSATARALIDTPSKVDVTVSGRRLARGYRVWPVGVSIAKSELYGWLRLEPPTKESGAPYPGGYCHFPETAAFGEAYFKQLTAEHLVPVARRTGFMIHEWQLIQGRENHHLDCRVYARAAAALVGLDRYAAAKRAERPAPVPASAAPEAQEATPIAPPAPRRQETVERQPRTSWLGVGADWLKKR
jgi:phage terminase large subunit GpA-like protein